jgi:hypothetical protein
LQVPKRAEEDRGGVAVKIGNAEAAWTNIAAAAALILFAALQVGYVIGLDQLDEAPRNYDPFGYIRQAELFRRYGVIGGLDTSFREPAARYLLGVAEKIDPDPSHWSYRIAPPAHHFEPRTDGIIDQYPPGTGFFLHFYPEGLQQRSSLFGALTLVFLCATALLWFAYSPLRVFAVVLGTVPLVINIYREAFSYSVHLSLVFSAFIGALMTLFFFRRGKDQIIISALLAFAIALGTSIRISNSLFFFGVIPIFYVMLRSRDRALGIPVIVVAAAIGILPLAIANQINVGSLFQTAYAERDKVGFALDSATAWNSLTAYFGDTRRPQLINWLALFALGGAIGLGLYRRQPLVPILPAFLNLMLGIGFFAVHTLAGPYYMMSHAIEAICGSAAYMWLSVPAWPACRRGLLPHGAFGLGVVACALLLSIFFFQRVKPSFDHNVLAEKFNDADIVYACEAAGLFVESGVYAACPQGGDIEFVQQLMVRVSQDGKRQFVVFDSTLGPELLDRVCPGAKAREFATVAEFGVFMIAPYLRDEAGRPCRSEAVAQ